MLDEIGVAWRISGATIEEYRSPFVAGWALRAELSLQSGIATLMTDRGGWVARLSDGNCSSMDPGPGEILLDAAVFHGKSGNCPVRLVLDRETLTLRLRGDCLPEELIIEDWTPTRVACGAWLSRIAIMSSDGTVLVMEEGTDGLLDLYAEDPDQTVIWDDLVFAENDTRVIKTERSVIECIEAPDGPFGLCLSSTGYFQMTGDESNPFFGAYPNLVPSAMGGMDTGVFGNILVARDSWIRHREFGWGYLSPGLESNWYWFQNEGWLAGDQAYQHYLYSPGRKNWIYYLAPDHSTNWVYDFSVPGWRPFAGIGRDR